MRKTRQARKTFPNPRTHYWKYPILCDKVKKAYFDSKEDPNIKQCHVLTNISSKFNVKRKTLENWKSKWDVNPDWVPYDTSVKGDFHRIFTDEQEQTISEYIEFNYVEPGLYFSDIDFKSLCFDTLDNLNENKPKFSCSPHFIRNFKDRNRFSSRKAHFKRRPDISNNQKQIDDFKRQISQLINDARQANEPVVNGDETQWQILPTNIKTWAKTNAKNVNINTTEDQKFHVTCMGSITADGKKLPCFMIAHGTSEYDEFEQFGEDLDPNSSSHSAKSYMTTEVFIEYLNFIRSQYANETRINLIVDSYSSHKSKAAAKVAADLNINLVFIPDGMTDLLQPLDYGVFSILKSIANAKLRNFMRLNPGKIIGIERSVQFLHEAWDEVSENTVTNAWEPYW